MSIKDIRFYGSMRKRFGRGIKLDVGSAGEAAYACQKNIPGFRDYLREHAKAPFRVLVGGAAKDEDGLSDPAGHADVIKFVPLVAGASGKGDMIPIVLGAVLMVAGTMLTAAFPVAGPIIFKVGLSMVIGGVAGLLANTPSAPFDPGQNRDRDAFSFNNPTLTTGQGGSVPFGYGRHRIGGHVISAGIDAGFFQPGGIGGLCATDDGVMYGDGVTTPWAWSLKP